jgi:hypothetical protein
MAKAYRLNNLEWLKRNIRTQIKSRATSAEEMTISIGSYNASFVNMPIAILTVIAD